jgi:hypothetical protein
MMSVVLPETVAKPLKLNVKVSLLGKMDMSRFVVAFVGRSS